MSQPFFFGEAKSIACVGCGNHWLHPLSVTVYSGGDEYSKITSVFIGLDGEGRTNNPTVRVSDISDIGCITSNRGDVVATDFACEACDALTRVEMAFHKGSTYISHEAIELPCPPLR
jgi:hypothetical protein